MVACLFVVCCVMFIVSGCSARCVICCRSRVVPPLLYVGCSPCVDFRSLIEVCCLWCCGCWWLFCRWLRRVRCSLCVVWGSEFIISMCFVFLFCCVRCLLLVVCCSLRIAVCLFIVCCCLFCVVCELVCVVFFLF